MKVIQNINLYIRLVILSLIAVTILSCSKKDECPYDKVDIHGNCFFHLASKANITINNTEYKEHVKPDAKYEIEDDWLNLSIASLYKHPESKSWESSFVLILREIPFKEGKYFGLEMFRSQYDTFHTISLLYNNIDALTAAYDLNPDWEDSHVELTEIDRVNQIVKGKFDIKFLKDTRFTNPMHALEAHVTGGFEAKYDVRN